MTVTKINNTEEKTTTEENKTTKKLNSRKFLVWLSWTILIIALVVTGFIRDNDEIILKGIEYYFLISCCYIGFNVWNKKIVAEKEGGTE